MATFGESVEYCKKFVGILCGFAAVVEIVSLLLRVDCKIDLLGFFNVSVVFTLLVVDFNIPSSVKVGCCNKVGEGLRISVDESA